MKHVYFLRRADGEGPIKIGCSSCPEARRKQIGWDMRLNLVVIAQAPGDNDTETALHRMFADHRRVPDGLPARAWPIPGIKEWFDPTPKLLNLIAAVRETGALPQLPANRNQIIFRRRSAGEKLRVIGDDFGITRERVRQIVVKMALRQAA